jgi:hypothetical protein
MRLMAEMFHIRLVATNPLNSPLAITDLTVIVEPAGDVEIESVPEIVLEAYESRTISIGITVHKPSTIDITHASFLFNRFFPVKQDLKRRGKRLHTTKAHKLTPAYAEDTSLVVAVEGARPRVEVEFRGLPGFMYEGEQADGVVLLRNVGTVAVGGVALMVNRPGMIGVRCECLSFGHSWADGNSITEGEWA